MIFPPGTDSTEYGLFTFPNSVVMSREPSWGTMRKSPSALEKTLFRPPSSLLRDKKDDHC